MNEDKISRAKISNKYLRSFGRVKGRVLRPYQLKLIEQILPQLQIFIEDDKVIDLEKYFCDKNKQNSLEIGFGSGEFLRQQALDNTNSNYIGCEPYINAISNFLSSVKENIPKNVRIFHGDARLLLDSLGDNCLDSVYILFPDPWSKSRHHKKRIVNEQTLKLISKKMKNNGKLLVVTDDVAYSEVVEETLQNSVYFDLKSVSCDVNPYPDINWVETKYQQKAIKEGRKSNFFYSICNK